MYFNVLFVEGYLPSIKAYNFIENFGVIDFIDILC